MAIYQEEIFGPVLGVVRARDLGAAVELINNHRFGNGTALFTADGGAARAFANSIKIGMVGIGLMGHGIATNLLKHGHELAVLDHPGNQPLDALRASGVQVMSDLVALAARSEMIILVLTGSPAVEAVLTGPGGVLQGLRPGRVVIDCSTALPASRLRMAQAVAAAGGRFLDAPMTRTPKEAAEGRLVAGAALEGERAQRTLQHGTLAQVLLKLLHLRCRPSYRAIHALGGDDDAPAQAQSAPQTAQLAGSSLRVRQVHEAVERTVQQRRRRGFRRWRVS
jgi:6-phosphogluconate dehydrogenase (decarboxylating)